jgi:hypothetical protein
MNCLKNFTEGNIEGKHDGNRGRRCKQLPVTLRKTKDNNKLKVDALDLSGELSLVEDMNLSQERQRNKCVWLYLLRMSVTIMDSDETRLLSTETFHLTYFGCHFPPPFLRASGQSN